LVHKPSETNRAKVIALVTNGAQQGRIAEHLGIDAKTLRKHYARELEFGTETLLSKVLNNLASIAIKGRGLPAVAACKYLLSCRGGYREHSVLGVEPTADAISCFAESASADVRARILARLDALNGHSDNAREIIAERLSKFAARNEEIGAFSEAYKEPAEGE
jgi:hypothetical protein